MQSRLSQRHTPLRDGASVMGSPRAHWQRVSNEPYVSPQPGTLASEAVTTPDVVLFGGQLQLFVGAVSDGKERLVRLPIAAAGLKVADGPSPTKASMVIEPGPADFDCRHVYDPAAIAVGRGIHLFYSASGKGPDQIGLAIAEDGRRFTKLEVPVCPGRSPEAVVHKGRIHLFHVVKAETGGYRIHLTVGGHVGTNEFVPAVLVLGAGQPGSWDEYEVTTPRIFAYGDTYYMMYSGSAGADRADLPAAFGLARSRDLFSWERYPANPAFETGRLGNWDDGAIWFGTVFQFEGVLYLLYEGGRLAEISAREPGRTQVGLAKLRCADFERAIEDW